MVYCSAGSGNPPSCMTSRASLSIGTRPRAGPAEQGRGRRRCRVGRPVLSRPAAGSGGRTPRCQRRIEGRQCARTGEPPRHLDRRPCRCCERASAQRRQRRTVTPMHLKAGSAAQLVADRVENMQIGGVLGVESVCGSSGAQAGRDRFSTAKVKPPKSSWRIGIALAVDIRAELCQLPVTQVALHLAPADVLQDLQRCRDSALGGEETLQRGGHLGRVLRVARRR